LETDCAGKGAKFAIVLAKLEGIQYIDKEGFGMLIDLKIPKGHKTNSAAKLYVALGATLLLVMALPYLPTAK
jgi:hypothetical protein